MNRLLLFCLFIAFGLQATDFDLADPGRWKVGPGAKVERRDGKTFITIKVSGESRQSSPINVARTEINLEPYRGQVLQISIRARGREVSEPKRRYNGVKFMLQYVDDDGFPHWPAGSFPCGTFDWCEGSGMVTVSPAAVKGELVLGLQDSSGEVEFDLGSFRVTREFPPVNAGYQVKYPKRIAETPSLRGVMSPLRPMTRNDLETLREWKVALVRYQLSGQNKEREENYDKWLDAKLDNLEAMLKLAPEYGLRFVIDLHQPPGQSEIFYHQKHIDHFLISWRKIAKRFKGNPAVWGYDLINEPRQGRPALVDYWNLQRLAAEEIRKIDPDTPIIVESNDWAKPGTFTYLSPLAMDNIIYQCHVYPPKHYTHQFVKQEERTASPPDRRVYQPYPGIFFKQYWNKEQLRKALQPVRDFQLRHNARIYAGEFSAVIWAPGAAQYLQDCIELFEEYGWDWSYHAFREWNGWSVEHEGSPEKQVPSPDNDRKRILLKGFAR